MAEFWNPTGRGRNSHAGYVVGHELAAKQSPAQPPLPGLEQLAQLHTDGKLTDNEFTAAKAKLLD